MNWQSCWTRIQSLGFLVFVGIVASGVGLLLFLPLLQRRHTMQMELQRLDAEIIRQEQRETQQKQEIEALKTDPTYVERTARDKLNLARPNETIFRFEPVPGSPRQAR
ncbi:MAG TPA: septum formation initiator family protein [Verrucomicrobiae bacterium]|nr:septum formation initiator family protein [Verrucomicrobiae bacterium]